MLIFLMISRTGRQLLENILVKGPEEERRRPKTKKKAQKKSMQTKKQNKTKKQKQKNKKSRIERAKQIRFLNYTNPDPDFKFQHWEKEEALNSKVYSSPKASFWRPL